MSNLPSNPPLPPPLPVQLEKIKTTEVRKAFNGFAFWEEYYFAELKRFIEFEQENHPRLTTIVRKYFQPVVPVAQNGPTCGMAALSMGLSLTKNKKSPEDLIEIAQSSGWTTKGEMFSCEWMANLARSVGAKAFVVKNGLQNHLGCLLTCLKQGGSILVPYDKDKDFAPFLDQGESAHWALVTGLFCLATSSSVNITESEPCFLNDTASKQCSTNLKIAGDIEWRSNNCSKDECVVPYVAAFQGQGNRVNLWPLTLLAKSNNNLLTVGHKHNWVQLPPGGIVDGLLGQAVLLLPN